MIESRESRTKTSVPIDIINGLIWGGDKSQMNTSDRGGSDFKDKDKDIYENTG